MRSLFRLPPPIRPAPKPALQRDTLQLRIAPDRVVELLRVRDPRARRIRLSVDERGARLTLPTRASLVAGERFVHDHRDWLATQLAAFADHADTVLERGTTTHLPLRGHDLPVQWSTGRASRVRLGEAGQLVFEAPWPGFPGHDGLDDAIRYNAWVEARVREAPEAYDWGVKRFKTRPPGEAGPYDRRL